MKLRPTYLIALCSLIALVGIQIVSQPHTSHAATPQNAAWLWRSIDQISSLEQQSLVQFAKSQNIQVLFVSIDKYASIYQSTSPTRNTDLQNYIQSQKAFLKLAHENGLKVQGLAGDPTWSMPAFRFYPRLLLEYVAKHNSQHEALYRYDGLQFDIEPYAQEGFSTRKTAALTEFLDTAQTLINDQLKWKNTYGTPSHIPLGFSVPAWLDGTHPDMPIIRRSKRREPVTQHLMRILNQTTPGNYIAVMAYRDFATGVNGTIDLSEKEMVFAETSAKNVGVYVGQETAKEDPEHITFYEEGMAALRTEMQKIHTAFTPRLPYQGVALHHLDSLKALKP